MRICFTVMGLISLFSIILTATNTNAETVPDLLPIKTKINAFEKTLIAEIDQRKDQMLDELTAIVNTNSGTLNKEGLTRLRKYYQNELEALGFSTSLLKAGTMPSFTCKGGQLNFTDHLLATRSGSGTRVFLNGHLDTVFPKGHSFNKFSKDGDTMRGPGVLDMKSGIVIMMTALRILNSRGLLDNKNISVLLNTDEEMGSLTSRKHIERLAQTHDLGLIYEGTRQNKLVRHRKGLGQARIVVRGRAAHSGSSHEQGISSTKELAHKIVDIERLTNYQTKSTVNVGMIWGGVARNQIPACSDAYIDLRYMNNDRGEELLANIRRITEKQYTYNDFLRKGPKSEFWGLLHRPAKPIHEDSDRIIATIMGISEALGSKLGWMFSGGGTDGSIAQYKGLPNADSLGADGLGAHSIREQASYASFMIRAKVAVVMLHRALQSKGTSQTYPHQTSVATHR